MFQIQMLSGRHSKTATIASTHTPSSKHRTAEAIIEMKIQRC